MILGVTLARGGSKGVPGKNIRDLCGKPLLAYTIEEALKSVRIDDYCVSSDSPKILEIAASYGASTVPRPDYLAKDDTPAVDAVIHAVESYELLTGKPVDAVVDLRATNPFKTAMDIDTAIDMLLESDADIVCGVCKLEDHHPARIKRIIRGRLYDFAWPEPMDGNRQLLKPDAYIRNGSIYAVRRDVLARGLLITGSDNIVPYIMPQERSVNIDTEMDFLLAEAMIREQNRV